MSLSRKFDQMSLIEDLEADYLYVKGREDKNNSSYDGLWGKRLIHWFDKLSSNGKLDPRKLKVFRQTAPLISEVPRNPYFHNPILSIIYKTLRMEGYKKTCLLNYEKLAKDDSLDWNSFNEIGEPLYVECDNRKFNERSLRHLRTVSIIKKKIPLNAGDYVLDIGGGYAQFSMCLRRALPKIKNIVIDFPEQLLLARYYIHTLDPNCRVNNIRQTYSAEDLLENINDFDVLLLPADSYNVINKLQLKLVCNFSSYGEMPLSVFTEYQRQPSISKAEYFFTINRLDSFPTYNNRMCILNYLSSMSRIEHLEVSPIWDYHYSSYTKFWIKKQAYLSRNFELIERRNS